MDLQSADGARLAVPVTVQPETTTVQASHEASLLHGATSTGEVGCRQLSIRVGLWLDDAGSVRRARWRAMDDAALRGFAEVACSLLEAGVDPLRLDGEMLRRAVASTAGHGDRADLVAAAIQTAMSVTGRRT
jgi:hypothetical protein